MDKKLFGMRINKARKDRGLTAEKLAEACNINSTYLRQIEGGTGSSRSGVDISHQKSINNWPRSSSERGR